MMGDEANLIGEQKNSRIFKKGIDIFEKKCIILSVAANAVACESGGTGRRARLRGVWFTPYGFKSRFSHQKRKTEPCVRFSFFIVK